MKYLIAIVATAWSGTITWVTFKTICGWCGTRKSGNPFVRRNVSHGVCEPCKNRVLVDLEQEKLRADRAAKLARSTAILRRTIDRLKSEGNL